MYIGIFLFIFTYILINYIIGKRIFKSLNNVIKINSIIYWIIFEFISLSPVIYECLKRFFPSTINKILAFVGFYYLALLIYIFFLFIIVYVIYKLLKRHKFKFDLYLLSILISLFIVIIGTFFSNSSYIKNYDVKINKNISQDELTIVMVSDIHLGDIIGNTSLNKMINKINSLNPDIVLIAGDLVDMELKPVIDQNMISNLNNIKSTYGCYLAFGNHDIYGEKVDELEKLVESAGVIVLRDESVLVNNEFYIIGRDNYSTKSLIDITKDLDQSKPYFLIDHTPNRIDESMNGNIDLQVSGHTHKGQLFPGNIVTNLIFPIDYGYKKFDNTNVIVSCGYGTWGPPIRIGSRSEICNIKVHN